VILKMRLELPGVSSLKEKRRIIKSLMARLQNKFNISIAEVAEQDRHRSAVLGAAVVTNDSAHGDSVMSQVINHVQNNHDAILADYSTEIY
jgi:uncharacterized protein YlxP (DUF503 family)